VDRTPRVLDAPADLVHAGGQDAEGTRLHTGIEAGKKKEKKKKKKKWGSHEQALQWGACASMTTYPNAARISARPMAMAAMLQMVPMVPTVSLSSIAVIMSLSLLRGGKAGDVPDPQGREMFETRRE
jgi:hypothetical protein